MPIAPRKTACKCLPMYVVYRGGEDYPRGFSVRKYLITPSAIVDAGSAGIADTMFQLRKMIPPSLHCVPRDADDDPRIIETWV